MKCFTIVNVAVTALALLMACSAADAATILSTGGDVNTASDWDNGLPTASNDGTIAVDGTNSATVFNFGAGSIVNHTAGTITAGTPTDDGGFNLTNGTWNMSGGRHITRYYLSNGATTVFNLSGGTIELKDVAATRHMGVANGGTFNVSGSVVLDGAHASTNVQTGGTVDIASDWTGSWTWGPHIGDDWKNLFTGSKITVDGSNIDGTTFDSAFLVTGGGQTLALNPSWVSPVFSLTVNRETGAMVLSNDGNGAGTILGYSITSATGTLDPGLWTSIAGNYDMDAPGPDTGTVDPDDNWTRFTNPASRTDLSEGELDVDGAGNGATITESQTIELGNGWIQYPFEDVVIEILLDNGGKATTNATFIGNDTGTGDEPFAVGDLNFADGITAADWIILRNNFQADLSSLTEVQSYALGDLDGDLDNDWNDFGQFKTLYNAANGAGSFEAMIASVPEPSSLLLLGLGGLALLTVRRNLASSAKVLVFSTVVLIGARDASAELLAAFDQNQTTDGITISANQATGGVGGGPFVSLDDGGNSSDDTLVSWNGTDHGVMLTVSHNRSDRDRDRGIGGFLATHAQADLYRDFTHFDTQFMSGNMTVVLTGLEADTLHDLTWFTYGNDSNSSGATFPWHVYENSVASDNLLFSKTTDYNNNTAPDVTGPNRFFATSDDSGEIFMIIGRGATLGSDDAALGSGINRSIAHFNGLTVAAATQLTLQINTVTGEMEFANNSGEAIDIDGYEIASVAGSLDPINWSSLQDQDYEGSGDPGDGMGWEEMGVPSTHFLSEAILTTSYSFADDESVSLAGAFNTDVDVEDVTFRVREPDGTFTPGLISYVTDPFDIVGDYNDSGQVEQGDLDLVLLNWGESAPAEWVNQIPGGNIGSAELDVVRTNWGNTAGVPASEAAVPEPTSLAWIAMGIVGWFLRRRAGG